VRSVAEKIETSGRWIGAVTDHICRRRTRCAQYGFHAAQTRLNILARGGTLPRASEVAYGEGIAGLAELAGPAAGRPGWPTSAWRT